MEKTQLASSFVEKQTPTEQQAFDGALLLTGGTGFFGKSILSAFVSGQLPAPRRLTILSRDPAAFQSTYPTLARLPFVDWWAGDVRSFDFPSARYDAIIHAATSAVTTISDEEQASVIRAGTQHVIDCARACGCSRILFTSSGAVYGPQLAPVDETTPCHPVTAYGQSKLAAERLLLDSDLDVKIARCFAFTGPYLRRDIHYAIGNFIRDACARHPIVVNGDGTPLRSYLFAEDLVDWLWTILEKGASGCVYNVGSDRAVSIRELAETVRRVLGSPAPVVVKGRRPEPGVPPAVYVPCVDRARRDLGLSVSVGLEEAIRRSAEAGKGKE